MQQISCHECFWILPSVRCRCASKEGEAAAQSNKKLKKENNVVDRMIQNILPHRYKSLQTVF
jgi:hypothetical protein